MRRRRRAVGFYTKGRGRGRKVIPITARSGHQKNWRSSRELAGAPIVTPPLHEEAMKKIIEYDSSEPFTRDEPFTKEQVEGFNRYTHFPSDINKEFREDVTAVEKEAVDTLKKHGITTIPPDVKKSLWYCRKAVYNYYLESSRARSIAPPISVVGPAKYPTHRIPRSDKIRRRASDQVETSKTYLRRSIGRHTKGKVETSEIEQWLPLARKAGSRVKFGKLYAEHIRKEAQEKTEKSGWDQQLASGNWDHVSRGRGRKLYDSLMGSKGGEPKDHGQDRGAKYTAFLGAEMRPLPPIATIQADEEAKARPKLAVGKKIELETPKGFVKGKITGFRSGDVDENFQRIDVKTDERVYIGVHPDSVRPIPEK